MEREHQEAVEKIQERNLKEIESVKKELPESATEDEASWAQEREQLRQ